MRRSVLTDCGDTEFLGCFEIRPNIVQEHHLGRFHLEQIERILVELGVWFSAVPSGREERACRELSVK